MSATADLEATFRDVVYEHPLLESELPTTDGLMCVADLARRYYTSPYGVAMNQQPYRFSARHGYDQAAMLADLGADVLPLEHQMLNGLMVARLADHNKIHVSAAGLTGRQIGTALLAASIHDSGESLHPEIVAAAGAGVGDVAYGDKTDEDRKVEANVRWALYERVWPDLSEQTLLDIEAIITHRDNSEQHSLVEAGHVLQTYVTAKLARRALVRYIANRGETRSVDDERIIAQLEGLTSDVQSAIGPHMAGLAAKYALIRKVQVAYDSEVVAA